MNRNRNSSLFLLILILVMMGPGEALISGGVRGLVNWILDMLLVLPGIIIGLSFHEFGHAKAAVLCGDNTPLYQGRVTLDPRAHIDMMGIISLIFIHFGWGKPVMVNPNNFKNKRRDGIIVGLAGITMNFLLAVLFGFLIKLIFVLRPQFFFTELGTSVYQVLLYVVIINLSLMLFNLLPVPPLDGFGVITDLFDLRRTNFYRFVYQNSMMILLVVIILDIPDMLLNRPLNALLDFIMVTLCGLW